MLIIATMVGSLAACGCLQWLCLRWLERRHERRETAKSEAWARSLRMGIAAEHRAMGRPDLAEIFESEDDDAL